MIFRPTCTVVDHGYLVMYILLIHLMQKSKFVTRNAVLQFYAIFCFNFLFISLFIVVYNKLGVNICGVSFIRLLGF